MSTAIHWYDPIGNIWSDTRTNTSFRVPELDGRLCFDLERRSDASTDWGQVRCGLPSAVLMPGSVTDIVKMINFCRALDICVGTRGQAHTQYGHSLAPGGLVISMLSLNRIQSVRSDYIRVDAGLTWRELLAGTLARGLTPPVLPYYLSLSVGGTLSVGGVSGTSYLHGAQVDNIQDLDVITGEGVLLSCSPSQNCELFEAVLGGLGQCAIIVSAGVRLIPAPLHARIFDMVYEDLALLLADFRVLLADERFSYVEGIVQISKDENVTYILEGVSFYATTPPDDSVLLDGLSYIPRSVNVQQSSYANFCDRVAIIEAEKKASGRWHLPHPGFDMFVPDQHAEDYIGSILGRLTFNDIPDFPCFIYGFRKDKLTRPFPRTPDTEIFFLFDVLRTTSRERTHQAIEQNRQFYEAGCSLGGRFYPITAVPLSEDDWRNHFVPYSDQLQKVRRGSDPGGILTPGPGIFTTVRG